MNYSLAYRRYSLPFRVPVRTAHGLWTVREGLFARLEREDGRVGFGECAPIPWFGTGTVDDAERVFGKLGSSVSDEQIDGLDAQFGCVKFALNAARESMVPTPACALEYLPVAALLPAGRAALEKIPALADGGFRTFKWKVGVGAVADEIALLDDVCAALPAGARLRLDANGAWARRDAERWLSRCLDYPVELIEQPVAADAAGAEDLLLGLAGDYPVPIALDESVIGAGDVGRWMDSGWPGIYVIKLSLLGGVGGAVGRLPRDRVVFSSALETKVGGIAALRMAFEFFEKTDKPRALGFGVWPLFEDARFDGPRAAPFVRAADLAQTGLEELWNAMN